MMVGSIDLLGVALNLLAVFSAIAAASYAYRVRNHFKGGVFEKPFWILGSAPLIGALAWSFHLLDILFDLEWMHYPHYITGAIFYLVLLYGFYNLYHSWVELR
ncbi:MAG: hypothetical protein ACE5KU_03725 [Nitrososphaerales archaeon]